MSSCPDWTVVDDGSPVIATAIHAGHHLRTEVRDLVALSDSERCREEDPHTDHLALVAPSRIVVHRSRFEVDVNRPRDKAIYRAPEDAWGLEIWRREWSDEAIERSLEIYDRFYRMLDGMLRARVRSRKHFVVLDIHSYNHRRAGPEAAPEPASTTPDLNLGTGSLDHGRWGPLVRDFIDSFRVIAEDHDVRENVRFRGGHMSRWIHDRYGKHGCCLALEFKKTFMDEWTGEIFPERLSHLVSALRVSVAALDERVAA